MRTNERNRETNDAFLTTGFIKRLNEIKSCSQTIAVSAIFACVPWSFASCLVWDVMRPSPAVRARIASMILRRARFLCVIIHRNLHYIILTWLDSQTLKMFWQQSWHPRHHTWVVCSINTNLKSMYSEILASTCDFTPIYCPLTFIPAGHCALKNNPNTSIIEAAIKCVWLPGFFRDHPMLMTGKPPQHECCS